MTTIDPRQALAAALQAQVAAAHGRKSQAGGRGAAAQGAAQSAAPHLTQRIRALPPDAPDRRTRAVRLFLEAELLRAFGDDLSADPQFATMVDAVQRQMRDDPALATAADALGDLLLAGPAA